MVATSPVHTPEKTAPTPIDSAKDKAKDKKTDGMPIVFNIPPHKDFDTEKAEYLSALDLLFIARKVIEETSPDLSEVPIEDIDFVWKFKGGKEDGQPKLFGVKIQDEIAKFHGARTWLVWFAADHCKTISGSAIATRASMYAALKRIGFAEHALTGDTVPRLQRPELVMFYGEYQRYGAWRREITVAADVFQQPRIPGI